jgi:hypothetical protein
MRSVCTIMNLLPEPCLWIRGAPSEGKVAVRRKRFYIAHSTSYIQVQETSIETSLVSLAVPHKTELNLSTINSTQNSGFHHLLVIEEILKIPLRHWHNLLHHVESSMRYFRTPCLFYTKNQITYFLTCVDFSSLLLVLIFLLTCVEFFFFLVSTFLLLVLTFLLSYLCWLFFLLVLNFSSFLLVLIFLLSYSCRLFFLLVLTFLLLTYVDFFFLICVDFPSLLFLSTFLFLIFVDFSFSYFCRLFFFLLVLTFLLSTPNCHQFNILNSILVQFQFFSFLISLLLCVFSVQNTNFHAFASAGTADAYNEP